MNRQWIGDDHDIRKICLLDCLIKHEQMKGLFINWMQTRLDRQDNNCKIVELINDYTSCYDQRSMDTYITECLSNIDSFKGKEVCHYKEFIDNRKNWWLDFLDKYSKHKNCNFVFLDPDTGIEPRKCKKQHISFDEIKTIFNIEYCDYLLIYQHQVREKGYIKAKKTLLCTDLQIKDKQICIFAGYSQKGNTPSEVYYLLQKKEESFMMGEKNILVETPNGRIEVY